MKPARNKKHLSDIINGCIENDSADGLKYYLSNFRSKFFIPQSQDSLKKDFPNLLTDSISKLKPECAKYLHEIGFQIVRQSDIDRILLSECKIQKIQDVYELLISLGYNLPEDIKEKIIKRVLEPYKIEANNKRIDVALRLLNTGFVTEEQFEAVLNKIISETKNKKFESNIKIFVRDFRLKKLFNELDTNS